MASVNKVYLLGNLGHTPKLSYTAGAGVAVCRISLATTKRYKLDNGETRDDTTWHTVVAYGRTAEVISTYCQKGNRLWVEGYLRTRKYVGRDNIEKTVTEVIVETVQLFNDRAKGEEQ